MSKWFRVLLLCFIAVLLLYKINDPGDMPFELTGCGFSGLDDGPNTMFQGEFDISNISKKTVTVTSVNLQDGNGNKIGDVLMQGVGKIDPLKGIKIPNHLRETGEGSWSSEGRGVHFELKAIPRNVLKIEPKYIVIEYKYVGINRRQVLKV